MIITCNVCFRQNLYAEKCAKDKNIVPSSASDMSLCLKALLGVREALETVKFVIGRFTARIKRGINT